MLRLARKKWPRKRQISTAKRKHFLLLITRLGSPRFAQRRRTTTLGLLALRLRFLLALSQQLGVIGGLLLGVRLTLLGDGQTMTLALC